MRSLDELRTEDPAWPLVQRWIQEAERHVEVVPVDPLDGEETLVALQVTDRSCLGAVALHTAGLLIDNGWVRVLGAGNSSMRGLAWWNGLSDEVGVSARLDGALIVGHDVLGGFFAVTQAGTGSTMRYFAPDTCDWLDLDTSYPEWLGWTLSGDVGFFYEDLRWPGWEQETQTLHPDQGLQVLPPLFVSGEEMAQRDRKPVPIVELWSFGLEVSDQIRHLPDGTWIDLRPSGPT